MNLIIWNNKNLAISARSEPDFVTTLEDGLFLRTMNASGGDGVQGLVGNILKFV